MKTELRAAVYLRISQDKTGEQAGVTRQREDCLKLVGEMGWTLHAVYEDNDISASTGKARPAYVQMLKDIKAGQVDAVVAWHPDRLYRKLRDLEGLIDAIDKANVIMRTVRAGEIDLSTPTGRMLARILGATAQAEGEIKADRWKRSWRQGREKGDSPRTGSRMFGYTREGDLICKEAAIARRMAADILDGGSIMGICRWLEEEGIETTRGGIWRTAAVRQYLNNPRLTGLSTLNGEVLAEGNWEPIVDRDTWETIRALLAGRARGIYPRVSILNGLIVCGRCGHRLITGMGRGARTYRCPNRPGMPGCGRMSSYAEPIEEVVEAYTKARLDDPATRAAIVRLSTDGAPQALAEITSLEARILELESQLDAPGVPVATILRAIDRSKERLEECQENLRNARPVTLPTSGGNWPADLERRRQLIEIVVEKVLLNEPTVRARVFDPQRVEIVGR